MELEHLRSKLQRSEAYLAEAQRLSHTGSFAYNPGSGKALYWSEELFRIFGLDPQRGIPDPNESFRLVHPDDRDRVAESALQGFRKKAEFSQDYRLLLHDGTIKHLQVVWHPVLDKDGELVEYVGTAADVTERKQAEERPRLVLNTTPALIHTAQPDGSLDFFNRTWLRYVGLSLEDLQGWKWTAAIHPEDVQGIVNKWRASIASGEPFLHEARVRRADGEYRWMLHHKIPERDEHGKIVKWYGSSVDIDDRKQTEESLRQSEADLRQILDVSPQHVAVLAPDGSHLYLNQAGLEYHGFTLEQWQSCDLRKLFHPDDWERMYREAQNTLSSGSTLEIEARLLRRGGKYRWFFFRYKPLRDRQGRITRWIIASIDIDDRKQAEERLRHENVALREEIEKTSMFEEIVGTSAILQTVLSRVSKVAPTDSTVLITGETGTGKELVARAIHRRSHRSSCAFVSVNCAAIPRDLIASELFGHEKGAFTGATQRHVGRFELAEGGSIFLDEIGDLPAETQIALLRVLQEHEFERVGGTRSLQANVRVIAATNRELQATTEAGRFRDDLFYRLNVFPIEIPPLRERREDIPLLVEYFINRFAKRLGKEIRGVNKKTLDLFQSYPWPGNVRELQNVIERSLIVCDTEIFSVDESWLASQSPAAGSRNPLDLTEKLAAREKEMIEIALRECGGRVFGPSGAAARLGMPRSTLESKIRSLEINKNRFKSGASSKAS
jgi:PAS domain S-box-containing protein